MQGGAGHRDFSMDEPEELHRMEGEPHEGQNMLAQSKEAVEESVHLTVFRWS